ncbi:hypothetical protein GIB67_040193 [Kingdonia uniflora]|uniref:Cytochrome P450 n=1 Tax=Kingdonia uniflora TaxID=39325 RepID=A0A7J7MUS7_9MAGN|nr:hypothetical protein GIB67_040193 [Kingdonia uniflora]
MNLYTLCVWLPFLLLLPIISQFIRSKRGVTRSRPPPSPSRLYIIARMFGSLLHHSLTQLSKKHGPIILLKLSSVPVLVVSSAEVAREVLKMHDHVFYNRPVLEGFRKHLYNFKDVALSHYGEYWRQMKKICVLKLLSAKKVYSFRSVRVQEVQNMIKYISLTSSCVVNLNEKLNLFAHTVILRIALGTSYEGKEFESGGNLSELLHGSIAMMGAFFVLSLFPYIDPDRQTGEYEDIADVLIRLEKEQFGEIRFTKDHIKAILMVNVYQSEFLLPRLRFTLGSGSSSVILIWSMAELAKNLRVMKKVQEEVRRCVGKKEKVNENDLDQLHFLKMIMKESLRLHPSASILIPRECMSHCIINGSSIIWAIARDPISWKNPKEFFPERFIDFPIDYKGNNFKFLPFGVGRRGCPGMSLGVVIIELALANLLYSFN